MFRQRAKREIGGFSTRIAEAACAASAFCWLLTMGISFTSFVAGNHGRPFT